MIYDKLADIVDKFDIFIFDAYGVFWNGRNFYNGCLSTMENIIKQGKNVAILSNSTSLGVDLQQKYAKRGMLLHHHYNYIISSGDLLYKQIHQEKIHFTSCPNPKTYYVIGKPNLKAFVNSAYQQISELSEADFVYVGVPYIDVDMYKQYSQYSEQFLPVMLNADKQPILWDTLTTAPFSEIIKKIAYLHIPALNANPDFTAQEGHPLISPDESSFVVRNGSIAEMLRNRGVEVLEYGKPHKNIYSYVFSLLQNDKVSIDKNRICMIGDTIRTDIKGAINNQIAPILCIDTGVTAQDIASGLTLEEICNRENVNLEKIIQIHSVGGK